MSDMTLSHHIPFASLPVPPHPCSYDMWSVGVLMVELACELQHTSPTPHLPLPSSLSPPPHPHSYDMWSVGVLMLELLFGSPHVWSLPPRTQLNGLSPPGEQPSSCEHGWSSAFSLLQSLKRHQVRGLL
ncbi:unnamed protein product [Closterium sp. NIES-54]